MTIKRKETRNLVVCMSGTPTSSSEFDVRAAYLSRHVPSIGSHYVVLADGDVVKGREHDVHGNVASLYNNDSVFIEAVGQDCTDLTPAQQASIRGVISRLQELYPDAEELDITY